MKFPQNKFKFETVATNDLSENIHKIINVKVHSHVTGEVIGYAHDFCDLKVRENKDVISCIAHNSFGFDIYFFLKAIRLSAWKTKDIDIGGTGLTSVRFASIDQLKLIDTMKYFQTNLGKLAETLSADEKRVIQKLTVQLLTTHSYFSKVWKELSSDQKNKVIKIIIGGKGINPYEKIESIDSLQITPEVGIFFSKDEFFSTLKGKMVDDESYENPKKLYILLKMRNLSDLNDLYNLQDVITLLEMMEYRFQSIQEKSGYNPRIINSASKLSGCIQREQTKSILALPVNNMQVEVFEKHYVVILAASIRGFHSILRFLCQI